MTTKFLLSYFDICLHRQSFLRKIANDLIIIVLKSNSELNFQIFSWKKNLQWLFQTNLLQNFTSYLFNTKDYLLIYFLLTIY